LFSIRTRDLIGLPLRHMPLHPKLREGLLRAMQGETDSNSDDGTERRRAADSPEDGTEVNTAFEVVLENGRFLSVIVSPVYAHRELGQDREPEGWVMVIQDVTHLRQAEQTRVNFIHAAAHDLRAPLGVAMGSLTMLATELEGSGHNTAEYQEIIDLGVRGIMRMETLIDDLLSLEHVESGIGLQSQLIDVRDLVERSTADITPAIQQREQTLTVDVPDTVPPIMGDMHWLCRALFNLLGNANKYTPPGGELALRVYMQDEELVIEVSDNGPGIAPDVQPRLFERFFRAPATRRAVRGTGLGLAIVKSVAEQHGGRVFVQSRVGQGSIFGMVFPLAAS
ncbi:MAG: HAMP domain-containing histidine kinase, partial [Anaerolineae bacterium]|nr:HAMP domain-containing histidine kinase [Anaerolineae bacterium]